ncbi:kinase [Virgibacillus flavescens]|uniref:kinase n=1 Tax=Virgibacillus flavescens TaxID=1611422 RepID=UPI003D3361E9
MNQNLEEILKICTSLRDEERYVLGIDGLSRSGKTTLVNRLRHRLEKMNVTIYVIHIDDHIVERAKRYNTGQEAWSEYFHLQWDVNSLRDQLFSKLKSNKSLILPIYHEELDSVTLQTINLPHKCLILIEGVFLQRCEWRSFYDYMIYLDCSREKRFQRESDFSRKQIKKFRERYWKAETYYMETAMPIENANLVLKG